MIAIYDGIANGRAYATHHAKLYPQHGDRIVTIDSVTSLRPVHLFSGVTMGWLLRLVTGARLVVGGPRQF